VQFRNYLSVAIGSLNELDTQLEIAQRVGYVDAAAVTETVALVDECLAVTYGLRRSLQ
jgi:four helix bundle protein